jgi:hypothetical protein
VVGIYQSVGPAATSGRGVKDVVRCLSDKCICESSFCVSATSTSASNLKIHLVSSIRSSIGVRARCHTPLTAKLSDSVDLTTVSLSPPQPLLRLAHFLQIKLLSRIIVQFSQFLTFFSTTGYTTITQRYSNSFEI